MLIIATVSLSGLQTPSVMDQVSHIFSCCCSHKESTKAEMWDTLSLSVLCIRVLLPVDMLVTQDDVCGGGECMCGCIPVRLPHPHSHLKGMDNLRVSQSASCCKRILQHTIQFSAEVRTTLFCPCSSHLFKVVVVMSWTQSLSEVCHGRLAKRWSLLMIDWNCLIW